MLYTLFYTLYVRYSMGALRLLWACNVSVLRQGTCVYMCFMFYCRSCFGCFLLWAVCFPLCVHVHVDQEGSPLVRRMYGCCDVGVRGSGLSPALLHPCGWRDIANPMVHIMWKNEWCIQFGKSSGTYNLESPVVHIMWEIHWYILFGRSSGAFHVGNPMVHIIWKIV